MIQEKRMFGAPLCKLLLIRIVLPCDYGAHARGEDLQGFSFLSGWGLVNAVPPPGSLGLTQLCRIQGDLSWALWCWYSLFHQVGSLAPFLTQQEKQRDVLDACWGNRSRWYPSNLCQQDIANGLTPQEMGLHVFPDEIKWHDQPCSGMNRFDKGFLAGLDWLDNI